MTTTFHIAPLVYEPEIIAALSDLLIETVEHGGSVSFMHPLEEQVAASFWKSSINSAIAGERVVLGAFEGAYLVGSVTLLLNCPPNQPHRAEIAKMMVRVKHRGKGIGRALLKAAEEQALRRDKWLLTLDTAEEVGAAGLYEKFGFQKVGVIPDFALKPAGGLTGTVIYYKKLN
ncbi:GNAT family N-acetyltransferase [Chitinophaga sp. Cy-1792]|uniref:GNAT family N-acetyltransferase n=1 Tax=Chitinophaga sp. Cy-1792 TaxID=2608339 RepID=UPI001422950D|nr:GNAT family N-acetyltransferase [Chitinophaga sp. Cy-1792]NIG54920.1 GNAT family N-acetyltransferase [Chitinophaga sp. Cy-1792]